MELRALSGDKVDERHDYSYNSFLGLMHHPGCLGQKIYITVGINNLNMMFNQYFAVGCLDHIKDKDSGKELNHLKTFTLTFSGVRVSWVTEEYKQLDRLKVNLKW
jgi:hypothetical protein